MEFTIRNDKIYFVRAGEAGCISACGENSVRFQAAPSGKLLDQNWTLMPQEAPAKAWVEEHRAVLETGSMRATAARYPCCIPIVTPSLSTTA